MKQFLFIAILFTSLNTFAKDDFTPYKKAFTQIFEVPVSTKVLFAKGRIFVEGTIAGAVCKPFHKLIMIDKAYWSTLNGGQKVQLMFHELGHCELYLDHSYEKDLRPGCKASIMHPILFTRKEAECFRDNLKYYVLELINRVKNRKFIK